MEVGGLLFDFEAVRAQVQETGRPLRSQCYREADRLRHRDPHALHVFPYVLRGQASRAGAAGRERRRRRPVEVQGELGRRSNRNGESVAPGRRRLLLRAFMVTVAFKARGQLRVDGLCVLLAGRLSYQVCYAAVGEGRVAPRIRGACSWPRAKRP